MSDLLVTGSMPSCVSDNAEKYVRTFAMLFSAQLNVRVGIYLLKIVHEETGFQIRSTDVKTTVSEIRTEEAVR
jgi:hypothetical protein